MDAIMVQTCTRCSRVNPSGAAYCYFDGTSLGGGGQGGPVAIGARPFPSPFVFPTGRTCRSFDELARACQDEWPTARDLLEKGYLETFLGGLGRLDLAGVAREASHFPDRDRGLDQLIAKLPSNVLAEPKLKLHPLEVNLGLLQPGQEQPFELHLENQGERLLYGSVTCEDGIWLAVGEESGGSEKHFQLTQELTIPVRVCGDRLQARNKPQEANLVVDTNGGQVKVVVRCEVPVKPFPSGLLAGAKTPRQVAELCMKSPKEAGPLFEAGAVEEWYATNGWVYPVKIPAASGLAAVQQFFEALGFTKPPRVEINTQEIVLEANPGDTLRASVEVTTQDKKPVYAHGTSDVPWLEVGRARCSGRTATINMTIPSVPNRPGQTLTGQLVVQANGNKRFTVPVQVKVGGSFNFTDDQPVEEPAEEVLVAAGPAPVPPAEDDLDFEAAPPPKVEAEPPRPSRRKQPGTPLGLHLIPALLLGLAVFGVVVYDVLFPQKNPDVIEGGGGGKQAGWNYDVNKLRDKESRLALQASDNGRFGIQLRDAKEKDSSKWKKLTYDASGVTNNTVVRINGNDGYLFGYVTADNVWFGRKIQELKPPRIGWESTMNFRQEQVRVTQHVEVVPSETGLLDTCLIYYKVYNDSQRPHSVGVRVMLDTYIGSRDDVPFTVPGKTGFVNTNEEYTGSQIPDYVEAIENDKMVPGKPFDPGTSVRINLKGIKLPGIDLVDPDKLRICSNPGVNAKWTWEMASGTPLGDDSAVAVYWPDSDLKSKETRHMAITFGLGTLDVGDLLAVSAPSSVIPDREFHVTVYVWNPQKGQKVKLVLPGGLVLGSGESAEKTVEGGGTRTSVSWRVRGSRIGTFNLEATSGKARSRPRQVDVKSTSIFG
jgi:hypothetical protein